MADETDGPRHCSLKEITGHTFRPMTDAEIMAGLAKFEPMMDVEANVCEFEIQFVETVLDRGFVLLPERQEAIEILQSYYPWTEIFPACI